VDRERRLDRIISKISPRDVNGSEIYKSELIYNVISFIPACDFVDNSILISNLGYLLSQQRLNTCIVDFKVFYPNLYQYLNVKPNKKSKGLIMLLKNDKTDFREEILPTKYEHLYLLSPSPQDLIEEYFDFSLEQIDRIIDNLKHMFDIVLIDVPNNPPLEFCLSALKCCHLGFFNASEKVDTVSNVMKLLSFAASIGISTAKLTNIVFTETLGINYDYKVFKENGFKIVAALPFVKAAHTNPLEGKLYVKDNPVMDKHYIKNINILVSLLTGKNKGD